MKSQMSSMAMVMLVAIAMSATPGVLRATEIFGPQTTLVSGFAGAQSLRSADINGDGYEDIVAVGDSLTSWWKNPGSQGGAWIQNNAGHGSQAGYKAGCDVADLDGDGDLDIAMALERWNDVDWIKNTNGTGTTWATPVVLDTYYQGTYGVRIGDVNGDGKNDIVAGAQYYEYLSYWRGNGGGSFTLVTLGYSEYGGHHGVDLADLDGNGSLDIIDARHENVSIHLNNGQGTSFNYLSLPGLVDSAYATAGDFDGDGDMDVVGIGANGQIVWSENLNGIATQWVSHTLSGTSGSSYSRWLFAGDMDNDGDVDICSAGQVANTVSFWENSGAGLSWTQHDLSTNIMGASSVIGMDYDLDGDLDLMATGMQDGQIYLWENSVPEPMTLSLLAAGALAILRPRRHAH